VKHGLKRKSRWTTPYRHEANQNRSARPQSPFSAALHEVLAPSTIIRHTRRSLYSSSTSCPLFLFRGHILISHCDQGSVPRLPPADHSHYSTGSRPLSPGVSTPPTYSSGEASRSVRRYSIESHHSLTLVQKGFHCKYSPGNRGISYSIPPFWRQLVACSDCVYAVCVAV
jgi:hypothetical protein